jgi:transcriptional regulator
MASTSTLKQVRRKLLLCFKQLNSDVTHKCKEGEEIKQTLYNKDHGTI